MSAQDLAILLTGAMVVATVWMAHETRKMARASTDAITLQLLPCLSLEALDFRIGKPANPTAPGPAGTFQVGLRLRNPGNVRVTFSVQDLKTSVAGATPAEGTQYQNTGGVIYPHQVTTFYCPALVCAAAPDVGLNGEVAFEMAFWATSTERHSFKGALTFAIRSMEPPYVEWLWKGWPAYA